MSDSPGEPPASPVLTRRPVLLTLAIVLALIAISAALAVATRSSGADDSGLLLRAGDGSIVTPTATAEPVPEASPGPGPALAAGDRAFAPMTLDLHPAEVGAGETLLVRAEAPGAVHGHVEVFGRAYPLVREDEVLWAVVGIPLEASLGAETLTVATFDAAGESLEQAEAAFTIVEVERPIDHVELTEEQDVRTAESLAYEAQLRVEQFVVHDRERQWTEPWIVPAEGWISTPFGEGRSYNQEPVSSYHLGLDIANDQGTPIIAPAPGRVAWVGEMPVRGLSVLVDHGGGAVSGYHHLVEWSVDAGQYVETGDELGLMGSTGLSTGPHLHWELLIYGVNVDPATWVEESFTP